MEELKIARSHLYHWSTHKTKHRRYQVNFKKNEAEKSINKRTNRGHTLAVHAARRASFSIVFFTIRTKETFKSIERLWKLKTSQNKTPRIGTLLKRSRPFFNVLWSFPESSFFFDFSLIGSKSYFEKKKRETNYILWKIVWNKISIKMKLKLPFRKASMLVPQRKR